MRLDKYLAEKFALTRNRAQFCIDTNLVLVNGKSVHKASFEVKESDTVEMTEDRKSGFVARSAVKLDDYLEVRKIEVTGFVCLDVGASTGGFTQVLLQRWAKKVIALDVGTAQLHESLRTDPRVISIENTDIRDANFSECFDLIVVDVSFVSLFRVFEDIAKHVTESTRLILLFKPQFEVGKENLRKTGVPKDEKITKHVLDDFCWFVRGRGFKIVDVAQSTLLGEAGNQEWIVDITRTN